MGLSPRIAIIGSGFSGIGLGIRLKQAGFEDFTIFEKAERVGGTWRDNTYPGAACDAPSHLYSYSFERKLDWSRRYAPGPEILAYLEDCVARHGLERHIRFGTEVVSAEFDESSAAWTVETVTASGNGSGPETERHTFEVVVSACGQLSRPSRPRIEGLDGFRGTIFHSAEWNHDHDLTGERVAVIGTGSSAIQFIPAIANRVNALHVFQRSAPWVLPKNDPLYGPRLHRRWRRLPATQLAARFYIWLVFESLIPGFAGRVRILRVFRGIQRRHLRRQVRDSVLREKLTPDYELGCKRIQISDDYYPTFNLPNVELVTESIERITDDGIVTADGRERRLDTIILGTGFASHGFVSPIEFHGLGGRSLSEAWGGVPQAHYGLAVAGFPNLFLMYGPNTNLGSGSIVYMLESQINHILDAVRRIAASGGYLDIKPEVQEAFNEQIAARLEDSVWNTGCTSWYRDDGGRITNNWPGFMLTYRLRTQRVDPAAYRIVPATGARRRQEEAVEA